MRKLFFAILTLATLLQSCVVIDNQYNVVPPGVWRATLDLKGKINEKVEEVTADVEFEEISDGELPFNFEVIYRDPDNIYVEILNGLERIRVDDVTYGHNRATGKDSIIINFPVFDSYIMAYYEEDVMEGKWYVNNRENYSIPFTAFHGEDYRFTELKKEPVIDVSGNWKTMFEVETETPYPAVGEFEQEGNSLTGTFRTETGDYRFLEGTIQANKVYLSCFDGAHAFLFEAKILEDESMIGSFRSGKHYKTLWEAEKDENFQLASADSLTFLKEGYDSFEFSFENVAGETVSLADYEGKVKLVQIFGTWCPNCRDETNYLVDYLANNPNEDLAVIGLAFEKHRDQEKAKAALGRYKKQLNIPYELLLAGYSDKSEASEVLPMLNKVISYPTLIFIDRDNEVRRIHTGFAGSATSKYEEFVADFEAYVAELLQEES
ncbi:MAG: TlpA disulfide reductase family protein [Bacteroidota bacterium]